MALVKIIVKSNGSEISVDQSAWDSVYSKYPDKYSLVPVATSQTTAQSISTASNQIPFKAGLNDAQKQSIIALTQKSIWNDNDLANWNYATNNAPKPSTIQQTQSTTAQQQTPTTPPAAPTVSIPFKAGLTTAQQQSVTDLSTKPVEQWSQTDKDNWAYATNNAPLPGTSGQSTQSTPTQANAPTGSAAIDPADKASVNALYQKYFDRDATSAELTNWAKETPATLEGFLKAEAQKYNYTSSYFKGQSDSKLKDALAVIDGSNLPPDIKEMWKTVVKGYPPGVEFNAAEILNTFNKVKQDTIDPYFKQLADTAIKDIQTNLSQADQARAQELEAERTQAGNNIRQAKAGLESAGMTFTGQSVQQLGADSAYAQPGSGDTSTVPAQVPFGGLFYEGTVNQGNRLIASSSELRNKAAQAAIARNAENYLGTQGAQNLGLTTGLAGTVKNGSLDVQKQSQEASTLQSIIDNYNAKQQALTNQ